MLAKQIHFLFAVIAIASTILSTDSYAQTNKKRVLAIGVPDAGSREENSPTVESAKRVISALRTSNGVSRLHGDVVERLIGNGTGLRDRSPTRSNILEELREMIRDCEPSDELWLYFCGHGLIVGGQSCLVPSDALQSFRNGRPSLEKLLKVGELASEMARSKAGRKVMILDCCQTDLHSRLQEGTTTTDTPAKWLQELDQHDVEVISSCQPGEFSLVWPTKNCALFSLWFSHGLKGAADANRDTRLTLKELVDFTKTRVKQSMKVVKAEICRHANISPKLAPSGVFRQTPTYVNVSRQKQHEKSFALIPNTFGLAINTLAELSNDLVLLESYKWSNDEPPTIAVGEFIETNGETEYLRGTNGLFGVLAADRLTNYMMEARSDRYIIQNPASVAEYLLDIGIRARHEPNSWEKAQTDYFLDTTFAPQDERCCINLTSSLVDCHSGQIINSITSIVSVDQGLGTVLGTTFDCTERAAQVPKNVNLDELRVTLQVQKLNHSKRWQTLSETGPRDLSAKIKVQSGDQLIMTIKNESADRIAMVPMIDGTSVLEKKTGLTPRECVERGYYYIMASGETKSIPGFMSRKKGKLDPLGRAEYEIESFKVANVPRQPGSQDRYGQDFGEIRLVVFPVKAVVRGRQFKERHLKAPAIIPGASQVRLIKVARGWVADTNRSHQVHVIRYSSGG